jgi:hypothetical protein
MCRTPLITNTPGEGCGNSNDTTDAECAVLERRFPAPNRLGQRRKWTI